MMYLNQAGLVHQQRQAAPLGLITLEVFVPLVSLVVPSDLLDLIIVVAHATLVDQRLQYPPSDQPLLADQATLADLADPSDLLDLIILVAPVRPAGHSHLAALESPNHFPNRLLLIK